MAVRWRPGLTLLALLVTATKSAAYWCDDMHPFVTKDFGLLGDFGSGPAPAAAAPLVNESQPLLHTETLTPTCGRADLFGAVMDVRAMRAEHLGANVWTLINSDHAVTRTICAFSRCEDHGCQWCGVCSPTGCLVSR